MSNKVRYGLTNVHIAFLDDEDAYETPVRVYGAVGLTMEPAGEETKFAADNDGNYFNRKKRNGYTGSLETALFPDAIKARMLGDRIDANGNYVEDADGTPRDFALLGQVEGDDANRRFVYYQCTASRPSNAASTAGDTITPDTETCDLVAVNRYFEDTTTLTPRLVCNEGDTDYDGFFTAVVAPGAVATGTTGATGTTE